VPTLNIALRFQDRADGNVQAQALGAMREAVPAVALILAMANASAHCQTRPIVQQQPGQMAAPRHVVRAPTHAARRAHCEAVDHAHSPVFNLEVELDRKLRQSGEIGRDPPRLVARQKLGC
jgi:hypothetical protein